MVAGLSGAATGDFPSRREVEMRTILIALGGAAIGAGAALLFAPETGATTRSKIKDKAVKYGNDIQETVSGKATHLRNKMQGMQHKAGDMLDLGRDAMSRGEEILSKGQEMLHSAGDAMDKASTATNTMESSSYDEP